MSAAAGYSGTPLAKKLGIVAGARIRVIDAPKDYLDLLAPLPGSVLFVARCDARTDLVHAFHDRRAQLAVDLARLRKTLRDDAVVWISWPKRS